jgi:hypothetical protein
VFVKAGILKVGVQKPSFTQYNGLGDSSYDLDSWYKKYSRRLPALHPHQALHYPYIIKHSSTKTSDIFILGMKEFTYIMG